MKEDKEHSLLYHAMHSRPMPGCLPLFFLLAAIVVGLLMLLVEVKMPERVRPMGLGKVTYRNDEITAMRMQLRSPLPLILPVFADPSRKDAAAGQNLPRRFEPALTPAPEQPLFSAVPASMVVDESVLLELPPPAAAPATPDDGKETTP